MKTKEGWETVVSVVMPAYNEGSHIKENLLETSRVISGFEKDYEIIAVNDGSSDNTEAGMRAAAEKDAHIKCISYQKNGGKGHAIRTGIAEATGRYTAYLDSDLELPPVLLKRFLKEIKEPGTDIVIGSKLHPESKLQYPFFRRVMSYGYYLMLKLMFHLSIHDTQTGIKLFKSEVIKPIAAKLTTEGYAFDVEILAMAAASGYSMKEAPIELNYSRNDKQDGRRIGIKDILAVFSDTLAVKKRVREYKRNQSASIP